MNYANPVIHTYGLLWHIRVNICIFSHLLVTQEMNNTTTIVHLMEPLLKKGHTVCLGNFCNTPALARLLKHKGTNCAGTIKINRQGAPKAIEGVKLKDGEIIAQCCGPVTVMKWCDI
jgi:hypothetical protein